MNKFDVLIIGSGAAGLMTALNLNKKLRILIIAKKSLLDASSYYAQGGISAVLDNDDSNELHINDTLRVAQGLGDKKAISFMVANSKNIIEDLEDFGVNFTKKNNSYHLTKEGGHSVRRVAHVVDKTGREIQLALIKAVQKRNNIKLAQDYIAVDLIKNNNNCIGVYVLNKKKQKVKTIYASFTVLATGGASKGYIYTTNPDTSTGDGIAMAYRAGCKIANMEFTQFHPTCLYHKDAKSFLISEAVRGEGGRLILADGLEFMIKYDARKELAPRDIVARAIDNEIKTKGLDCVYLDISYKSKNWILKHFPTIYKKCLSLGVDISKKPIPVVPAAHYTCGGVSINLNCKTDINNLYAVGEVSCSGVHGANRMASNSLLECFVFAKACAKSINGYDSKPLNIEVAAWDASRVEVSKEVVFVNHLWDEVRRLMWDFVGIVRNNRRLFYARKRLNQIEEEVNEYYRSYIITNDLIELRNLVTVAKLTVASAIKRKESRGLHFNEDYPDSSKIYANSYYLRKSN